LWNHCCKALCRNWRGSCFSHNRLLAMPIFYKMIEKRFFLLITFWHVAHNKSYNRQVPPEIYRVKPVWPPDSEVFRELHSWRLAVDKWQSIIMDGPAWVENVHPIPPK
jgi:hypothetical protein